MRVIAVGLGGGKDNVFVGRGVDEGVRERELRD